MFISPSSWGKSASPPPLLTLIWFLCLKVACLKKKFKRIMWHVYTSNKPLPMMRIVHHSKLQTYISRAARKQSQMKEKHREGTISTNLGPDWSTETQRRLCEQVGIHPNRRLTQICYSCVKDPDSQDSGCSGKPPVTHSCRSTKMCAVQHTQRYTHWQRHKHVCTHTIIGRPQNCRHITPHASNEAVIHTFLMLSNPPPRQFQKGHYAESDRKAGKTEFETPWKLW